MKLKTFVNFVINDVMKNEKYASMFDDSSKEKMEELRRYADIQG